MKQIIVKIRPDGKAIIDMVGFHGQACMDASKLIEQALGKLESRTEKPELYEGESELKVKVTS